MRGIWSISDTGTDRQDVEGAFGGKFFLYTGEQAVKLSGYFLPLDFTEKGNGENIAVHADTDIVRKGRAQESGKEKQRLVASLMPEAFVYKPEVVNVEGNNGDTERAASAGHHGVEGVPIVQTGESV